MKTLLALPLVLLLPGCAALSNLGGLMPGMGGNARVVCSPSGEGLIVQPVGAGGLSTTQSVKDLDDWCASLLKAKRS